MATGITREVIESYLKCKYKSYLRQIGEVGSRSDYESLLFDVRSDIRAKVHEKILGQHGTKDVARAVTLTRSVLRSGAAFILDATLEDDLVSLCFDGLKRIPGPSDLGDFHYIPLLFYEGRKVRKEQRILLELYALLLARLQGRAPTSGIVWCGHDCRAAKVRLNRDVRKAESLLAEVKRMHQVGSPPRLILNDHCRFCEFRQRCLDQAVQEDNISLLRGMREKEVRHYARKGILTVTQLAHTFRPRRRGKRAPPRVNQHNHALQALAIRDKKIYVLGTPQLPTSPVHIYLDVEGRPEETYDYLIGMIVVEKGVERRYSFWADDRDQKDRIFEQFLDVVARYDDVLVFCYGSYEKAFLKRMRKRAKRKKEVDRVLKVLINTLSLVYTHLYFPVYSNGLKDVGECLGCAWNDPGASGVQSIVWRARWEATREEWWKDKLAAYNLEDCTALRKVTEFIYAARAAIDPAATSRPCAEGSPPITPVEEIDRLGSDHSSSRVRFFNSDFEYVSNCAHFDYQRQRVFVRTNKILKKHWKRPKRLENKKLSVSRHIEITSRKCPKCGGTEITRWSKGMKVTGRPRIKRMLDLVFTPSGIKRKIIECRAAVHECASCGTTFMPERYSRLAKHSHALMSWAMFEHVAHRTSFRTLEDKFREFFGLNVFASELHVFKSIMARKYRVAYKRLLGKILSGKVLHVDETEVRLHTGKGYVWVFTNLEEVVFIYRPTREGAFLQKLLKNFQGVLISDFYAAYDSIDCPQQKCLIHLTRDMNEDLLNNPYDDELQAVTSPFGKLLRDIVATIDQHGLKQRHLQRHEQAVTTYFESLAAQSFRSEPAQALRERLMKYQDKLFKFLKYDGVPWNNNNAEHAIKQFVYYREHADGFMREAGLKDYLVLLSIRLTCRYKGVSFLKFLLSRERDVDAFCQGRRSRRSPGIEVYPKGVARPEFRARSTLDSEPKRPEQEEGQPGN
jgi:predicted RecB family nuclease